MVENRLDEEAFCALGVFGVSDRAFPPPDPPGESDLIFEPPGIVGELERSAVGLSES